MNLIWQIQSLLFLALSAAAFGLSLWALIHASVTKPDLFIRADKRTKTFWVAITGGATLISFLMIPGGGFGGRSLLLTILPLIAAGMYLTDVRPAIKEYSRRGPGNDGGWRSW